MKKRMMLAVMAALLILAAPATALNWDGYFTNILAKGNLRIGTGSTPDITQNGDDLYIEGQLEVDGVPRFDATTMILRGVTYTLPSADAVGYLYSNGAGALSFAAPTATVAWDDIGVPDADKTLAFAGYKETISSTLNAAGAVLTMTNTTADLGADVSFLDLKYTDDGDANGFFLRGYDAAGAALKFSIGADGALIITGTAEGTNAITVTGGDMTLTDGDVILSSGDLSVTGNFTLTGSFYQTAIASAAAGNVNLTVDAAGNGTITVGGISTGNTIFPGAVVANGNVDIGNAATDTLTIASIIDGNVTLDDGATDSPSLIFKDATDETVTVKKTDAANLDITVSGTEGVRIMVGNLRVGDGSPGTAAMDGEDFYVNGQSEFDGTAQFDGATTVAAALTVTGTTLINNSNGAATTGIGTGTTSGAVSIGGGSDTVAVNSTTWDVSTAGAFTGVTGVTFATGEASTITLASNGAADDLTISVTGANDASLLLASAGTGADAISLTASAGGIDISGNVGGDIDIVSTGKSVNITSTEAAADQIKLSASGAIAGNAINAATTDGGIVLTAGGAANGDITLTAGDAFAMNATGTAAITSSDWGITTAGAVTKLASVGYDSGTVVYNDVISCDAACIKGLRAAPKQLVAAPGANKVVELVSAILILNYGTAVYTESVDDMVIQYNTSGQDLTAAIEATGFIDAGADTVKFVQPSATVNVAAANCVNKAVELFNTGDGEYAGLGDSVMTIHVAYRIHNDGL